MPKRPVLSPAREQELCAAFPHHTNAELAARYGLTVRQVQHIGSKSGLVKTASTISATRSTRVTEGVALTVRVQQLVQQSGDAGISRAGVEQAMPQESPNGICSAINQLTSHHRIHRAGPKGRSRWFATKELAQAFQAAQTAAKYAVAPPAPAKPSTTPKAARPRAPQPAPRAEATIPEGLQIQYGAPVPGPEARWHANARPILRNLGPGVYTDEPSSWVTALTSRPAAPGAQA